MTRIPHHHTGGEGNLCSGDQFSRVKEHDITLERRRVSRKLPSVGHLNTRVPESQTATEMSGCRQER